MCWTEAPEKAKFLRRQRQRWYRGCLETLLIHRGMLGNPRYRAVGLVALPTMLLFEVAGPVIELSGYLVRDPQSAPGVGRDQPDAKVRVG